MYNIQSVQCVEVFKLKQLFEIYKINNTLIFLIQA